jgi:hypothetical protein
MLEFIYYNTKKSLNLKYFFMVALFIDDVYNKRISTAIKNRRNIL